MGTSSFKEVSTTYAEKAPPAYLAGDVHSVWRSSFGTSSSILPDGCLDIVVAPDRVFVAGPDTTAWSSGYAVGAPLYGIRFLPGRAPRVLGVAASELLNQRVQLLDLWGRPAKRIVSKLYADPIPELTKLVAERLDRPEVDPVDPLVDLAVRRLQRGGSRVTAVLRDLDLSDRQLRRRFASSVGYGPATYLRVARLQRVRDLALGTPLSLADLAFEAGYADQAHLSRDVRELAGATARNLLRPAGSLAA